MCRNNKGDPRKKPCSLARLRAGALPPGYHIHLPHHWLWPPRRLSPAVTVIPKARGQPRATSLGPLPHLLCLQVSTPRLRPSSHEPHVGLISQAGGVAGPAFTPGTQPKAGNML